jgi:Helicase conserved C-terminal domain
MQKDFIVFTDSDEDKHRAAERFVSWLEESVVLDGRGDEISFSEVNPIGRFWLGRLGPKDFVTLPDERNDRLEPCAIGLRLKPATSGPWAFQVTVCFCLWKRTKSEGKRDLPWKWDKLRVEPISVSLTVENVLGETIHGADVLNAKLREASGADGLSAEIRVRITGKNDVARAVEVTVVNTGQEVDAFASGRLFECSLHVEHFKSTPFALEALPDSFRFDRRVDAFGINCGVKLANGVFATSDAPHRARFRPEYWASSQTVPDLKFDTLAMNPLPSADAMIAALGDWSGFQWSNEALDKRASDENWSPEMRDEASLGSNEFQSEFARIVHGRQLLEEDQGLHRAFSLMNKAMAHASRGKYDAWRPFQFAFLLANLKCLVETKTETEIVDVVWFATGGGKTETYLGLLITAAFLDRLRGKLSGITAWSRFPLRMLSLQQTQRFANAIAGAEIVREQEQIDGDSFSLGFLVGGAATPNRVKKDGGEEEEDADKLDDQVNPYLLLEDCPYCRLKSVSTRFDRTTWRLLHECSNSQCPNSSRILPLYVVDHEIWRFLPTIVIGTLDKAANIARQTGMRGLVGPPWGLCPKKGHGYTYAIRRDAPTGCLVPDCRSTGALPLPFDKTLFAPSFRLQDELHLLRDSLGAVDAHYEGALDVLQFELSDRKPKILASSATLSGYKKQVEVLYQRQARVFPQPPPREGAGFWTSDSPVLMRQYIALAPRSLTVEFVADRIIVSLQLAVRKLIGDASAVCSALAIDERYCDFLVNLYGTNVVYGNTLQDIDAVVRSSETQYAELSPPPRVATLTGKTPFEEVRKTLARLESPEEKFEDRLHLVAASSMMSHGVDINRLNVMLMLAFPLGVAEFIQATARVGRQWPALVIVVPKMTRERDASLYRSFREFVLHGDRFVEPIPITRKSRRVLERTVAGLELARVLLIHEPEANKSLAMRRSFNELLIKTPDLLEKDMKQIARAIGMSDEDEILSEQLKAWFEGFRRNLVEPTGDTRFISELSPTGNAMTSLRDVEEQVFIKGDSER